MMDLRSTRRRRERSFSSGGQTGRARLAVVSLSLGFVLALVASEIVLRAAGHRPWKDVDMDSGLGIPRMHEPDAELGWRNKEGRYVFGQTPPTRMTFWSDHTRATAPVPVRSEAAIVVLGCSFVQGWALSDEDTFAWKLQERFPGARVSNFGTAAYGTTQSLLALQRFLGENGYSPGRSGAGGPLVVVYGFSDFHAGRNVAAAPWLRNLAQLASRAHVATPYASLAEDGELLLHPPTSYPAWPLHRQLATVALLEGRWADFGARERKPQARSVTEALLSELNYTVQQSGGTLVVALLSEFQRNGMDPYRAMLKQRGFLAADCVHPGVWSTAGQVPLSGHPDARINDYWADCIEQTLRSVAPGLASDSAAAAP